jgi:hypothetical protein
VLTDQAAFDAAWHEMLDAEIEDLPTLQVLDLESLPESFEVPPAELAALDMLGLLPAEGKE